MRCHICGKSAAEGINLYRQNPKGEAGVWACAAHSKPVDDQLVRTVAAIQHAERTRKCGHPLGVTRWCPDCEEIAERKPKP